MDRISARVELTPGEQIEGVTYQEAFKRAGLESPPEETPVFTAIVTVPEIGKDRATTTTESDVAPQFDHERIWLLRMPTYQTSTGGQMGMASPSSAPVGYDAHTIMMIDPDGDWYAVEVPE